MICCHCGAMPGKRRQCHPHEHRDRGDLWSSGKKCRDRRRRALIDVRRPHVERHRRDLETQSREQQHQPDGEPDPALAGDLGDGDEIHRAGESVDQRTSRRAAFPTTARRARNISGLPRSSAHCRDRTPPPRKAQGSSARVRDRARSGRQPRSASACRWSQEGSVPDIRISDAPARRGNRRTAAVRRARRSRVRIFRNRAKPSMTKLPPNAIVFSAEVSTTAMPARINRITALRIAAPVERLPW